MKHFNTFLKVALLTLTLGLCHNAFAGSSSSLTVNVAETDTGKGLVYVSTDRTTPDADQVSEEAWWTTSTKPQNTTGDNDTHTYYVSGQPNQGYQFMGVQQLIDEGVYGDLIPVDDEGFCTVTIECLNPANIAIYYAVFQLADHTTALPLTSALAPAPCFNLQGQRVADRNRAIHIRQGHKVLILNE